MKKNTKVQNLKSLLDKVAHAIDPRKPRIIPGSVRPKKLKLSMATIKQLYSKLRLRLSGPRKPKFIPKSA